MMECNVRYPRTIVMVRESDAEEVPLDLAVVPRPRLLALRCDAFLPHSLSALISAL